MRDTSIPHLNERGGSGDWPLLRWRGEENVRF
jgi:hypothetical protein